MTDRIALAIAACEGLSDEELAHRGPGGFRKMIFRKRAYAAAARQLAGVVKVLDAQLKEAHKQLAAAQATIQQLEALDKPITDTSAAEAILQDIMKGASKE